LQRVSRKHVANRSTCHAKESTAGHSVDESTHEHRLDIHRCGAWNKPDYKEYQGDDIYRSTTIELPASASAKEAGQM